MTVTWTHTGGGVRYLGLSSPIRTPSVSYDLSTQDHLHPVGEGAGGGLTESKTVGVRERKGRRRVGETPRCSSIDPGHTFGSHRQGRLSCVRTTRPLEPSSETGRRLRNTVEPVPEA